MDEFKRRKRMTIHDRAKDYIQMREERKIRKKIIDELISFMYLAILILIIVWILIAYMMYELLC